MGCKRKLRNITITHSLKVLEDPHWAGKLFMDSPHEAAVDSQHPHKVANSDLSETDNGKIPSKHSVLHLVVSLTHLTYFGSE